MTTIKTLLSREKDIRVNMFFKAARESLSQHKDRSNITHRTPLFDMNRDDVVLKYFQNKNFNAGNDNDDNFNAEWVTFMMDVLTVVISSSPSKDEVVKLLKSPSSSSNDNIILNIFYGEDGVNKAKDLILGSLFGSREVLCEGPIKNFKQLRCKINKDYKIATTKYSDEYMFSYDTGKFLIKLGEETARKDDETPSPDFWKDIDVKQKLYERDENGVLLKRYGKNLEKIKKSDADHTYEKLGLNPKKGETDGDQIKSCTGYINDCLIGKDLGKCKAFLMDITGEQIKQDIKDMNPQYLEHTISALKLPKKSAMNYVVDMELIEVCSFDDWIESLHSKNELDHKDIELIRKNRILRNYIDILTSFVNGEPSILNKNYTLNTSNVINPEMFKSTIFQSYGLIPNYPQNYQVQATDINPTQLTSLSIERLVKVLHENRNQYHVILPLSYDTQSGGALHNRVLDPHNNTQKQTGVLLGEHFTKLVAGLAAQGKVLSTGDTDNIKDHIIKIIQSEKALLKSLTYINEYVDLLNSSGDNSTIKNINLDYLKQYVDVHTLKSDKLFIKQINATTLMKTILEAIQ